MSGIIKVNRSNNYRIGDGAASNYLNDTAPEIFQIPDVVPGSWKIHPSMSLQEGFGAFAQVAGITPITYIGFQVCFLKNQSTGFTTLYETHLDAQATSGTISDDYKKAWVAAGSTTLADFESNPSSGSITDEGIFVHPAYLAIKDLNNAGLTDKFFMDFTYQSPIFQDQPNTYLNDTAVTIDAPSRVLNTSRRTDSNYPLVAGSPATIDTAQGAYGDNPWPKCSMNSFFSASISSSSNSEDLLTEMLTSLAQCGAEQADGFAQQWEEINGGE